MAVASPAMDGLQILSEGLPLDLQQMVVEHLQARLAAGRAGTHTDHADTRNEYTTPPNKWHGTLQSREMLHYGCLTNSNRVFDADGVPPLPQCLVKVVDHLVERGLCSQDARPDTATVNFYAEGRWALNTRWFTSTFFRVYVCNC